MSLVQPAVYFRALFLCLSVADQSEALKLVTLGEGKKIQFREISFLCFSYVKVLLKKNPENIEIFVSRVLKIDKK